MQSYEESLKLKTKLGDIRGEGQVLNNLGLVRWDSGQYSKGGEYYRRSLEIFRELGDLRGEGDTLGNLGNIYYAWGQYPKAVEHYEKSQEIGGKLGDWRGQGNAVNNLGLIYAAWGQYPKAVEYYETALAIATKLGDEGARDNSHESGWRPCPQGRIREGPGKFPERLEQIRRTRGAGGLAQEAHRRSVSGYGRCEKAESLAQGGRAQLIAGKTSPIQSRLSGGKRAL